MYQSEGKEDKRQRNEKLQETMRLTGVGGDRRRWRDGRDGEGEDFRMMMLRKEEEDSEEAETGSE